MSELESALKLAWQAGDLLKLLNPKHNLLRYHVDCISDDSDLHDDFFKHFWDKETSWKHEPGSRVNTYCFARYFLAMNRAIEEMIIPKIGPVEFLYQDKPIDSCIWLTYWQQGVSGLCGGVEGEKCGHQTNRDLALRFVMQLDPRMIAASGSDNCSISPLVQTAINKMAVNWGGIKWSWECGDGYGLSIVTLRELLAYEINKQPQNTIGSFGIRDTDRENGLKLIRGLEDEEPVMEPLLRHQIFSEIPTNNLYEQIIRAPKT